MKNLIELKEWHDLSAHHAEIADHHMRDWFDNDANRFAQFNLSCGEIFLDYSRNRVNDKTINLLCDLANTLELPKKIEALFSGQPINETEARPALHTALRDKSHSPIFVNGRDIALTIASAQEQMRTFTAQIHSGEWRGATGKPIAHIVNIGIGGSYTGPMMCSQALKDFAVNKLQFHFVSSIDKNHLDDVLQLIDPETTLFIVSSKSFTTIETLTNARSIMSWLQDKLGQKAIKQQFVAVTAAKEKAVEFGIPQEQIFPIWEWVGGRYSVWSAIGLPVMLMIGPKHFADFLAGAHEMDLHFRHTEFSKNIPLMMGMLGIWYMNFFGANVQAIIPYSYRLRSLIPYLQQVEMESNGKTVAKHGDQVHYATGPVLFGEEGVIGQHAYHQLLHQGKHLIPIDFVLIGNNTANLDNHHDILMASALSQAQALMRGKTHEEALAELLAKNLAGEHANELAKHQIIPGNKPSNILFLNQLTPKNLGALLALYEHKIFVQGVIWDINSFDQWGVELGKQLLPAILQQLQGGSIEGIDSATLGVINRLKKCRM